MESVEVRDEQNHTKLSTLEHQGGLNVDLEFSSPCPAVSQQYPGCTWLGALGVVETPQGRTGHQLYFLLSHRALVDAHIPPTPPEGIP